MAVEVPCGRGIELNVQEGAAIIAFKLVSGGVFDEEGVTALLLAPGENAANPACSGTRNLQDNLSDLKAQASVIG